MNTLSLFDGISCGRVALERAGIKIENYYASEIDKYSIAVAKERYPDTVHLGDVKNWKNWNINFEKIDILLGGSPCQGFSFAGKQLNFEDHRSKLFFEYVDILNEIKTKNPNVIFLLENVKMKKEYQNVISRYLGLEPIEINSELLSAQKRKRLYWTNIKGVTQPEDAGILLKDVLQENSDLDYSISENWAKWFAERANYLIKKKYVNLSTEKAITMTARQYANWNGNFVYEGLEKYIVPFKKELKTINKEVKTGKVHYFNKDENLVYYRNIKGNTKFFTLTPQGGGSQQAILEEGYIRRLTPTECERLQTLPDNYTKSTLDGKQITDAQRYKMIGNAWTVDVIAHILKQVREKQSFTGLL